MLKGVAESFTDRVNRDPKIKAILEKVKKGIATQGDISNYADLLGEHASHVFQRAVQFGAIDDEVVDTITAIVDANYKSINGQAILQLRAQDKKNGLNIVIKAAPNERTVKLVEDIKNIKTEQGLNHQLGDGVITTHRQFYDDFQRANAELREELGYDEIIIRTYDDVGLHGNHTPCQYCLSRAGTWNYTSANYWVFGRHTGCGCHITISTPSWTRSQIEWAPDEKDENGRKIRGTGKNVWTE